MNQKKKERSPIIKHIKAKQISEIQPKATNQNKLVNPFSRHSKRLNEDKRDSNDPSDSRIKYKDTSILQNEEFKDFNIDSLNNSSSDRMNINSNYHSKRHHNQEESKEDIKEDNSEFNEMNISHKASSSRSDKSSK